jgi:uncharacterized cupredoxin-like copper-binding protein
VGRPFYTRIALLGISMFLFFDALILIAILLFEPGAFAYPFIVGGIAAAFGLVIYFWRPWGLAVGVLGGLLALMFVSDSYADNITSPDSFFDFAYRPVFGLAGALFLLGGSSVGLVQHFRHRTSTDGPVVARRAVQGVLGLVAVLSLYSAVMTVAGIDSVSADDKAGATTITANVTKFDTDALEATAGSTTKFVVKNDDPIIHTFTIDALDIDVKVGPRSEALLVLDAPTAGTYEFHCRISGHENMRGMLTVK